MSPTGERPAAGALMAIVARRFPDLAGLPNHVLGAGWDSVALDVDDRLVFKFPRHAAARDALVREAALLAVVRPAVTLPVPDLVLVDGPPLFSRHDKIPGEHLRPEDYPKLDDAARDGLAARLALFFTELHALDRDMMRAAGALPIKPWLAPDAIEAGIADLLPASLRPWAHRTIAAWTALPPDPLGETYGFFDGHGWNMAFDHAAARLNGIYDFADSGFAGLHQEFVYPNFVSPDLTARTIAAYERLTGRAIDRRRVHLLSAVLRLSELAEFAQSAPEEAAPMVAQVSAWAALPEPD